MSFTAIIASRKVQIRHSGGMNPPIMSNSNGSSLVSDFRSIKIIMLMASNAICSRGGTPLSAGRTSSLEAEDDVIFSFCIGIGDDGFCRFDMFDRVVSLSNLGRSTMCANKKRRWQKLSRMHSLQCTSYGVYVNTDAADAELEVQLIYYRVAFLDISFPVRTGFSQAQSQVQLRGLPSGTLLVLPLSSNAY